MKLKDMQLEDLELMSYTDITYLLLKENKKTMNTASLFKEICNLLEFTDEDYASKIGDYYTSLNIDKRFVLLENNEWDIRDNHSIELDLDEEENEEEVEEENEDEEEKFDEEIDEVMDEDIDDDIEDLAIIDDDELEDE